MCGLFLPQRCKYLQQIAQQSARPAILFQRFDRDLLAVPQRVLIILLDARDCRRIQHIRRAFKMEIQAAVIEIDRADDRFFVVADEGFGVNEARNEFVNSNACGEQLAIMRMCQGKRGFFVRNVGENQPDVYAALRSSGRCV